jgi:hypothetical protein
MTEEYGRNQFPLDPSPTATSNIAAVTPPASNRDHRPLLVIDRTDLPTTARDLSKHLTQSTSLFQRAATLVKLVKAAGKFTILPINVHDVVNQCHAVCRPVERVSIDEEPDYEPVTLPERVARLYLNLHDKWGVRELEGVCRAPILSDDGAIRIAQGYDPATKYWCVGLDLPPVPQNPSRRQAEQALKVLRQAFATFPFADAPRARHRRGQDLIDLSKPPGFDESTYLTALITAVCRPSLDLAPAFVIRAPQVSGLGTGKGKLVRALARIAYDYEPKAITSCGDRAELEKRLSAALSEAEPAVFLDNVNNETLRSNFLAQVITENPSAIRPFGTNRILATVNPNALIVITGNAVGVSEDLARRFLIVDLDAACESPELRPFAQDFLSTINARRGKLLAAVLTIWRWGQRNSIQRGLPLGSFDQWTSWCRDPLLALGCADPVLRIADVKRDDPHRVHLVDFFTTWHGLYGDRPLKVTELDDRLRRLAGSRSRQALASFVANLVGTRAAGYVMIRNKPVGAWGTSTYVVKKVK